jgi:hypothetical protein
MPAGGGGNSTEGKAMWDWNETTRNISAWTPEELARYAGLHVAWSRDGKKIVGFGRTGPECDAMAIASGLKGDEFILDYLGEEYAIPGVPSVLEQDQVPS